MNSVSDTVLKTSDEKVEAARQAQNPELNAKLVELGKVSDTSGGWVGSKVDIGFGFTAY